MTAFAAGAEGQILRSRGGDEGPGMQKNHSLLTGSSWCWTCGSAQLRVPDTSWEALARALRRELAEVGLRRMRDRVRAPFLRHYRRVPTCRWAAAEWVRFGRD